MEKIKYRLNNPGLAPRRTKLEIPGWAGKRELKSLRLRRGVKLRVRLHGRVGRRKERERNPSSKYLKL